MTKRKDRPISQNKRYVVNLGKIFDQIDLVRVDKKMKRLKRSNDPTTVPFDVVENICDYIRRATLDAFCQMSNFRSPKFSLPVTLKLDSNEARGVTQIFGKQHDETRVFCKWKFECTVDISYHFSSILCKSKEVSPKFFLYVENDKMCVDVCKLKTGGKGTDVVDVKVFRIESISMKLHKVNKRFTVKVSFFLTSILCNQSAF